MTAVSRAECWLFNLIILKIFKQTTHLKQNEAFIIEKIR